jgi:hypothetical protein
VERDISLDFLHHLVNMPIEHGHRPERFSMANPCSLCDIPHVGYTAHNGICVNSTIGTLSSFSHAVAAGWAGPSFELNYIHQTDEVDAVLIEALPALAALLKPMWLSLI